MSKLFPLRSSPDVEGREPELLELDDERTDEVFDALGSETARQLLLELHEAPRPASELADAVDTTIQNVQYHLTKLDAADLVEVVDTWYAENGSEMDVYAPTDEALVLFAGRDPEPSLRRLLKRLVGVFAPLAVGATAVALYARRGGLPVPDLSLGGGSGAADAPAEGSEPAGDGGGVGDAAPSAPSEEGGMADGDGAQSGGTGQETSREGFDGRGRGGADGGDGAERGLTGGATDTAGGKDAVDVSAPGTPESGESATEFQNGVPMDGNYTLINGTFENVTVGNGTLGNGTTTVDPTATAAPTDPAPADVPSTVVDTTTAAADAAGADPLFSAGLFVAGGLVALGGLFVVDRMLGE